jgi:hypothetical protein
MPALTVSRKQLVFDSTIAVSLPDRDPEPPPAGSDNSNNRDLARESDRDRNHDRGITISSAFTYHHGNARSITFAIIIGTSPAKLPITF